MGVQGDHDLLQGRLVFLLFLGAVFVETIGPQTGAQGDGGGGLRGRQGRAFQPVQSDSDDGVAGGGQLSDHGTAQRLGGQSVEVGGFAQAQQQYAAGLDSGGSLQQKRLLLFAFEAARGNGPGKLAAGRLIGLDGGGSERAAFQNTDDKSAFGRQRGLREADFHERDVPVG